LQVNATPLLAPTEVDANKHTASFRISLPLSKLPGGRYSLQTIVIAPGTQHSAFNRTYMALQYAAPPPAAPATPGTTGANPPRTDEPPKPNPR
jgi:hypothetical protein